MATSAATTFPPTPPFSRDFSIFWLGQAVSSLGTAFTQFALPLLVFKLTASALDLGLSTAATYLPYLFFGLIIGAWADRVDRKRLMIGADLLRALLTLGLVVLAWFGALSVGWIYVLTFANSTFGIAFGAARLAAVNSLVTKDQLISANSRITLTTSLATVVGPLLAGLVVSLAPVETVFIFDSLSFLISVGSLLLIKTSFNQTSPSAPAEPATIRQSIQEGLSFLWHEPVILSATILSTLLNFIIITAVAQQVFYVKQKFGASDSAVSWFFLIAGVGSVIFSGLVTRFPKSWSPTRTSLVAMLAQGLLVLAMGLTDWYWLALVLRALVSGCSVIWNIQITSLIQARLPNHLIGRVSSVIMVLAWAVIPVGSFLGGVLVEWTDNISLVYIIIGSVNALSSLLFFFSPLNRKEP